jgi:hypothetical protein
VEKYPSFEQRNQILDLENEEENNNIEVEKKIFKQRKRDIR